MTPTRTRSKRTEQTDSASTATAPTEAAAADIGVQVDEEATAAGAGAGGPTGRSGPPRDRKRLVLVAGALGVALILVGAGLALASRGGEDLVVTAGNNLPFEADSSPIAASSSPVVVVDPTDPQRVVAAARVDRPRFGMVVQVSKDAGRTWSTSTPAVPAGEDRPYAPDLAFDAEGNLFALFTTLTGDSNTPGAVWLERSTDGGSTFSEPVQVAGAHAFGARLAVSPDGRRVHVTWVQSRPEVEQLPNAFPPPPNPVVMATSTDGGSTFGAPAVVSGPERARVGAATPIVAPDGTVYVLYQDFGDDAADFENVEGPVHEGTFSLVMARSADGRTFAAQSIVDDGLVPTERFVPYFPKQASVAIDGDDGDIYVAWSDGRNGDADVFVRRSEDNAKTWKAPVLVNDGAPKGTAQYLPVVTVGVDSRVHVAYLDRSFDSGNILTGGSLATSFDNGETWASLVVSDVLFDSRVGPGSERNLPDPGSRLGLVALPDGNVVTAWTDARRGDLDTDKQEVYLASVRFERK